MTAKNYSYDYDAACEAADYIKQSLHSKPITAIVSGSGLGAIEQIITDKIIIDSVNIPYWPSSTAPGHEGKIIAGKIHDRDVIMLQGRVHYYEGYSMKAITFPVRVLGLLGVREYVTTNASGAINKNFRLGEVIAIRDHINLMGTNPLIGPNDSRFNERFPDMTNAYDKKFLAILESFGLKSGVYAAFTGPSFETPAEVKMAGLLGADLAGMSTVPEVIIAHSMGMRVCALSCAANAAAGIDPEHILSSQEVLDNVKKSAHELADIISRLIKFLNQE
ncbi:MAG: purine-nucleoside phosphorylase [Synergistaceae bacterium]|nr:purine-nucleoside phosphorylase [Synergistaceae bacterium]